MTKLFQNKETNIRCIDCELSLYISASVTSAKATIYFARLYNKNVKPRAFAYSNEDRLVAQHLKDGHKLQLLR